MTDRSLYKIIGERIKLAREQAGLSQETVADELAFRSTATISHFETGARKISVVDLQRLSTLLKVPITYFLAGEPLSIIPSLQIKYRANVLMPQQKELFQPFIQFAEQRAVAPVIDHDSTNLEQSGAVGRIARHYLQMGGIENPPVDPREVARHIGVPVFDWSLPDDVSGLTLFVDDRACIGVNNQHPNVRQRFSIAHELGHVVLHRDQAHGVQAYIGMELNDIETGKLWNVPEYEEDQKQERQANWFAADLLMPKHLLEQIYEPGEFDLQTVARLFDVSAQALFIQVRSLGLDQ